MGDKDELISSTSNIPVCTNFLVINKTEKEEVIIKEKINKFTLDNGEENIDLNRKIEKKEKPQLVIDDAGTTSKEHPEQSLSTSSKLPNLYHKFVESFDAVLQNFVSEGI